MSPEEVTELFYKLKSNSNKFGFIAFEGFTGNVCNAGETLIWVFEQGKIHSLVGPSVINYDGCCAFYIHNKNYPETDFWNHPLVIKHKLHSILSLQRK